MGKGVREMMRVPSVGGGTYASVFERSVLDVVLLAPIAGVLGLLPLVVHGKERAVVAFGLVKLGDFEIGRFFFVLKRIFLTFRPNCFDR